FKSLFGLSDSNGRDANQNRDHLRRSNGAGGGRWPGSGGPGGPGRNGECFIAVFGVISVVCLVQVACPVLRWLEEDEAAKCLGSAQTESGVCLNSTCDTICLVTMLICVAFSRLLNNSDS
ncbi:hypothetical protein NECAME_16852, partial [Necator americanus]